jgi:hypothetical protein
VVAVLGLRVAAALDLVLDGREAANPAVFAVTAEVSQLAEDRARVALGRAASAAEARARAARRSPRRRSRRRARGAARASPSSREAASADPKSPAPP